MKISSALGLRKLMARDQGELPPALRELFTTLPAEVIQPETAKEVKDIVQVATKNRTPLVARGAGSTAFGQVIPVLGGMVVDLNFFKSIRRIERQRREVVVEAGVRWSDLDAWLEERGMGLGSYPSSWYSTVGGWVATGGYGMGSWKFGHLKDQVSELWVCSHDGADRRLKASDPEFDLWFGSEGQLGVILEVALKVRPRAPGTWPVLLTAPGMDACWKALGDLAGQDLDVFHVSVYDAGRMAHFDHVLAGRMKAKGGNAPQTLRFGGQSALLVAAESQQDAARLKDWGRKHGLSAAPDFQASFCWSERFYPLRGKSADQMFLGNETLIENKAAAAYCDALRLLAESEGLHLAVEGEAAGKDRSLVLASFYGPAQDPEGYARGLAAVFAMEHLAASHGGAPYHVGIYNTPFLSRRFPAQKVSALRAAKAKLDPNGVFNPGKFFQMKTARTAGLPSWLHVLGTRLGMLALRLPGLGGLARRGAAALLGRTPVQAGDKVHAAFRECVSCGFCLPVCPAYLTTRDERTTARGKLFLAAEWIQGKALSDEDVRMLHSCMHCGGCTAVCQSAIDLVPAWDELEPRVAEVHFKPRKEIVDFVKDVEQSADYKRLLRQGTIAEYKPGERPGRESAGKA